MAFITGTAGGDTITPGLLSPGVVGGFPTLADDTIEGRGGQDTLDGGGGNDSIDGGDGADLISGGAGSDTLIGGTGTDTLNGGADNDTIIADGDGGIYNGEAGNDLMFSGIGIENMDGGTGIDTIDHSAFSGNYRFDMGTGLTNFLLESYTNFEHAIMGDGHDTVIGSSVANTIDGAGGNDTISAGAGNDIVAGGAGRDTLDGGSGVDTLNGGNGDDVFIVDSSLDVVTEDANDAPGGRDAVQTSISYVLGTSVLAGQNGFGIEDLLLTGVAAINGTGNGLDNGITGNGAINTLSGLAGNDTLSGLAGNDNLSGGDGLDSLNGGTGNDTMNGGDGDDIYVVDTAADVVAETFNDLLGGLSDTVNSSVTYTLGSGLLAGSNGFGIENLTLTGAAAVNGTGNGNANLIIGNSAINTLSGVAGNDSLSGLAGNDNLSGGAGSDSLNGGAGVDSMNGGDGNDTFVVDNLSDIVTESANTPAAGVDTVESTVTYTLGSGAVAGSNGFGIENLILIGAASINGIGNANANIINGNSGNNILSGGVGNDTLSGGSGVDSLVGGTGVDSMNGGGGNDRFVADNVSDIVTENTDDALGGLADTVESSISYALGAGLTPGSNGFGIENLVLTGALAINGAGNSKDNSITGNASANVLSGGLGADVLRGGAGNDTLNGGDGADFLSGDAGIDVMNGGDGDDISVVDNSSDIVTEIFDDVIGGVDTVQTSVSYVLGAGLVAGANGFGIENLTLTGALAINGAGNGKSNSIKGNSAANNLSGGAGDDTLVGEAGNDSLNGGSGNDSMAGGDGSDTYTVDSLSDSVTEFFDDALAGTADLVQSSVTYALGSGLENLSLVGTAVINGTGNAKDNRILGNSAANVIDGGDGADTLNGGAGVDSLDGGNGNDIYVVQFGQSTLTAPDKITGFTFGSEAVDLLSSLGAALAAPVAFTRAADNAAATTLSQLATAVFLDANGGTAGNQALVANAAALVVATNAAIAGTYLVVNDAAAVQSNATDIMLNITGFSGALPALGAIPVGSVFL
jgi:Ca2+-binding RTX toxin-like protein